MTKPATIFCDIDGTLLQFCDSLPESLSAWDLLPLPGVEDKLALWHSKGHRIILVTGRPEPYREKTESQLHSVGIVYDQLIMGCGNGARYLINDGPARAIELPRDQGIGEVEIVSQA